MDGHAIVRVGLRNLINDEPDLRVVSEAGSCAEALQEGKGTDPDVIVLDLRLPDGSGVEIIDSLKRVSPRVRVRVLTSFADDTLLLAALKAGADGYLLKDVAEADLIGAIRDVARAGVVATPPIRTGTSDRPGRIVNSNRSRTPKAMIRGADLRLAAHVQFAYPPSREPRRDPSFPPFAALPFPGRKARPGAGSVRTPAPGPWVRAPGRVGCRPDGT